jgi:hypothetical protein
MEYDKSKKLARHGWIDLGNRFDLYRGDRELHMKAYPAKGTEMRAYLVEAKAIHEGMGASVGQSYAGMRRVIDTMSPIRPRVQNVVGGAVGR